MRIIILVALLLSPCLAQAEETVPVPKKRPKVLSVSPEYIKQLKNRNNAKKAAPNAEMYIDLTNSEILTRIKPESGQATILKQETEIDSIPVPGYKPQKEQENKEQRLVSFSLPPQKIDLDKNLENFLETHALELFKKNKNLKLDIQAYATTSESTQNANIRIALARALEVRKFLLTNNIEPNRLKLSPIGQDKNNNTSDRIDLVFIDISQETY